MTFEHIKRFFEEPKKSYFLFGPRGTGKSTMTQLRHPSALIIDLRLTDVKLKLASNPQHLLDLVHAQPKGQIIIIDEIQKIPELLSLVHVLIEEKKGWIFILTGSSSRKLKRAGVDLLAGRALKKHLHPFMATELGEFFNLEEAIKYGLLPEVVVALRFCRFSGSFEPILHSFERGNINSRILTLLKECKIGQNNPENRRTLSATTTSPLRFDDESPLDTLKTYVALYMEEEVKSEGIVRNIEPFARFLEAISFSHGSQLNLTNVARECMVKRTTVSSWISILEDLLIAFQLEVFTKRAKRELSVHPKFYYFDAGVYRTIRPQSIEDPTTELEGPALEGLVAQHLRAWCDYTAGENTLSFWRTRSNVEVDFVLHSPLGFWAIEVKNSRNISLDDLRHLKIFLEDYPEAKAIFLYRGTDRVMKGNILCMPCSEFLLNLRPNQSIINL